MPWYADENQDKGSTLKMIGWEEVNSKFYDKNI